MTNNLELSNDTNIRSTADSTLFHLINRNNQAFFLIWCQSWEIGCALFPSKRRCWSNFSINFKKNYHISFWSDRWKRHWPPICNSYSESQTCFWSVIWQLDTSSCSLLSRNRSHEKRQKLMAVFTRQKSRRKKAADVRKKNIS